MINEIIVFVDDHIKNISIDILNGFINKFVIILIVEIMTLGTMTIKKFNKSMNYENCI